MGAAFFYNRFKTMPLRFWIHFFFAAIFVSGAILVAPAHAQSANNARDNRGGATITLKETITPTGPNVTLADIFDNTGAAGNTVLGRMPQGSQNLVFSAAVLQARANMVGLNWANPTNVRQVVVGGAGNGAPIAQSNNHVIIAPNNNADREIAVLIRDLPRGAEIGAADIGWMSAPANAPRDALTDGERLIGMTTRRALSAQTAIRETDVMTTPMVRRGEMVTLVYESGGLRLSMRGRALANAGRGETVRVTNLQSNRVVEAMVVSDSLARVLATPNSATITSASLNQ